MTTVNISLTAIPKLVKNIINTLEKKGYPAYLVGGCVRDLILNREPKDWDITTSATPEEIITLFDKTVYENDFGTVTVVHETEKPTSSLREVEITPFRVETDYSDNRRPDQVTFTPNLEEDLKRRDFTINALAYRPTTETLTDLFDGIKDLKNKAIKTVGEPVDRLKEDYLRMLRAVRLATELEFALEKETAQAIKTTAENIKRISPERIRDELVKIIMSKQPLMGFTLLRELNIEAHILPELHQAYGVTQRGAHIFDVWEHSLRALQHAADKNLPLELRLAVLFHDIGKPPTKRYDSQKKTVTFYGHEVVGARMAQKILTDLKFSKKTIDKAIKLIRYHMFFMDTDQLTLSAVRRLVAKVGPENVWDLMNIRACDRIGMGRPKETPYRLRKYKAMIEEATRAPTSVGMLKIDGDQLMKQLKLSPGPQIGKLLQALLGLVLDQPELNTQEKLLAKAKELNQLPPEKLQKLVQAGKAKTEDKEQTELETINKRHHVS
ncbi:MAG: CCA tRNA nucleotidyltransferase [Patescibacteria group bacterium]